MILQHFLPLLGAIIITLLITPLSIKTAVYLKLIDIPDSAPHKIHKVPVPKAGGIAIAFALFLVSIAGGKFLSQDILAILLASIPVFLYGILDDAKGLSAGWKLLGQMTAAILLIWMGVYVRVFESFTLNTIITILWLIGMTNAFNLVDSMDGLAVGLAAIAGAFFMLVTVDANQADLTYLSAAILGCCVGMLFFNSTPAKTFLGDSGSQLLGFMLAALAIAYNPPNFPQLSSWFVPILLMSVPVFDTTYVIFSRLRRKLPIYKAGRDHIFHSLINLKMSSNQAVTVMHVSAILTGCLAFIALPLPPILSNAIFILSFITGLFALLWLDNKTRQD
ncbi:MAG TPA: undecaprenyl/decaprenyl-phosphate alpha-N-acetylglucosaminyl 1-phosphate transferase [Anaerolineae bacterium]|nr:undecaprenyl/decaprenyl-phosphate alpha-N-acetylglucosaminyl 1-phosphate transferase [Anaerolineae bacterium]